MLVTLCAIASCIYTPLTLQPLTFELSLSEASVSTLLGSKVKCVVRKAYIQSGRGLRARVGLTSTYRKGILVGDQSDYHNNSWRMLDDISLDPRPNPIAVQ